MTSRGFRSNLAAVALTLTLGVVSAPAQTVISSTRYDQVTPSSDSPQTVVRDGAGNLFVVTGNGVGMVVTKYNSVWTAQWRKYYLGGENHAISPATAVIDPAGDLVVVGTSVVSGSSTPHLTVVRLASSTGAQIYETNPLGLTAREETLQPAAVDAAGNIGFLGFHASDGFFGSQVPTAIVVNYSTGALKWSTPLPSTDGVASFGKIRPDSSGDWYAPGAVYAPDKSHYGYAGWRLRASDGAAVWRVQILPSPTTVTGMATDVAISNTGNPVFVGHIRVGSVDGFEGVTVMVDKTTANAVWINSDHLSGGDDFLDNVLVEPTSGDILVGGSDTASFNWEPLVMRLNAATGVRQWLGKYTGGVVSIAGTRMTLDGKGGIALAAQGYSDSQTRYDVYTADFNLATGALNWGKKFPTVTGKTDRVTGVFADGSSVVVVGGTDSGATLLQDLFFQRIETATGNQQLLNIEDIPNSADSSLNAYAVGPDGSSVLSGGYSGSNSTAGALLVCYNADGSIRWSQSTATNPAIKGPFKKMAVDSAGNIYGTGNVSSSPHDFYLAKINGVNGSVLWETTYSTPGTQSSDDVMAITLASNGDPVVTGSGNNAFATVRFAAATGLRLWVHTFSGGGTGANDTPTTVSPAANGDIFVAGWSTNPIRQATMFRLKAADGTQVWKATYDISGVAEREVPVWSGVAANGDLMVAGNINPNDGQYKIYAQRINGATGQILWTNLQSTPNGNMTACSMTPSGDLLIAAQDSSQILAFKILSSGSLGWTKPYSVGPDYITEPRGATADVFGNLIIGGYGYVNSTGATLPMLISLSGDDGHTLWDHPYQYPGSTVSVPFALQSAPDGKAMLVSQASFSGTYRNAKDLFLARFQPLDPKGRTFTGTVQLSDVPSASGKSLTVEVRPRGSSAVYATKTVTLGTDGAFSAAIDLPDGNYDVTVRSPHFLVKRFANLAATTNIALGTMSLINGDVNGDNKIDAADQTALTAAFRSTSAKANWNPNADLNGDGQVSASDQAILGKNFGKTGD